MPNDVFDQYSSVRPLFRTDERFGWVPESERDRLSAYNKYEQIYWSEERAFMLLRRGAEIQPILVPNPKAIVDSTAHYFLKGFRLEAKGKTQQILDKFIKREGFTSRFHTAKHAGVVRGDWVMHMTADPNLAEGKRISLVSVDPASYFPVTDDDDPDKIVKVYLAYLFKDSDGKEAIKRLTYEYADDGRIIVQEGIYETDPKKWVGPQPPLKRETIPEHLLPETITTIPVYHFKNQDWDGQPFGSSELRGFERILSSQNQTISDEELALALEGLGVYATDGGPPQDEQGNTIPWEVSPARVMEVATGSYFKRVEGVTSVSPMLEHVKYLEERMHEAAGTFRAGQVDVQVAESGIALAIRFLPTLAKLEERDQSGIDILTQMFYDWTYWHEEFEGDSIGGEEIDPVLGAKLPLNRQDLTSELNNMLDRHVISAAYYRTQMNKLFGYVFPSDEVMDQQIVDEQTRWAEFKSNIDASQEEGLKSGNPDNPNEPTKKNGNKSNNKDRTNESDGTEASQTLRRQQKTQG